VIKVSAILLAAGLSQRMGKDKLLLEYNGKPILQIAIELLTDLPVYERIIVTTEDRAKKITLLTNVFLFFNPKPEAGKSSSIKIGVEAATGTHFLFLTADQPKLKTGDILPLLEAAGNNQDKIIYPVVNSNPTSPTLFPEYYRMELINLQNTPQAKQNDLGGQIIRDKNRESCLAIEPDDPFNFIDTDTYDDYKKIT